MSSNVELDPSGFRSIGVLGAGAWGSALANAAARTGRPVMLWARDRRQIEQMLESRQSPRLPGVSLADAVTPTNDLMLAASNDLVLSVVPTQATRSLLQLLAPVWRSATPIVFCSKGIEQESGKFLHEIAGDCLPGAIPAVLSGPSFAADVSRGLPTAVTLAAANPDLARRIARSLAGPALRLYHSDDLIGVEIGGAAKNVLAIACGIAAGRGLGASAGAALVARGFAELTRFGRACGARPETLMGLSGLGDLVLTCGSSQSRNYAFGLAIGRGETPGSALHGRLAEGAATAPVLVEMARSRHVEMPISAAVADILAGRLSVDEAVGTLLARPSKAEAGC